MRTLDWDRTIIRAYFECGDSLYDYAEKLNNEGWGFAKNKNHVMYLDGGENILDEQHCVFTWDGKSGEQRFFIDGIETASAHMSNSYWELVKARVEFYI